MSLSLSDDFLVKVEFQIVSSGEHRRMLMSSIDYFLINHESLIGKSQVLIKNESSSDKT